MNHRPKTIGRRVFACRNIGLKSFFPTLQVPSQVSAAPDVSNRMDPPGSQSGGDAKSPEANGGLSGGIVEQASDANWSGDEEDMTPEGEDIIAPLKFKSRSMKETGTVSPKSSLRGRFGK